MSTSPDLVNDGMPTEAGAAMFNDVVTRFVDPELERRLEAGTWAPDDPVVLFQVVFPYGAVPEVRINRGIGGTLMAKATRAVEAGEEVCPEDFSEVAAYEPADKDRDVPHITGVLTSIGWHLLFKLGIGHPKRHDYLARAEEFLETARESLCAGRLAAFADNAFSATELLARGELLAYAPTVDLVLDTKDHGLVASTYKLWADLGNTEKRFAKLLKQMSKVRKKGRYLDYPLDLTADAAESLLRSIEEMHAHAAARISGLDMPGHFNVYATRDLRAGEFVGSNDYALKPPRSGMPS
jgi:uncharacterized protein (UPF0332 family)